jgi:ribosome-associated toxin RatA of RatAB toxin-antitoxin module
MSQATTSSRAIGASRERILDVIADVVAYPEWADGVREVTIEEADERGRPLRARFDVASGIVNGWYVVAYRWSDPDGVAWQLVESPLLRAMDGEYVLSEGEGGDTHVEYRLSVDPAIPLIGPLRRKAEQHLVSTALNDLALRAEGSS